MCQTILSTEQPSPTKEIADLARRARAAQRVYENFDQKTVDEVVVAAGWALVNPRNNRLLAEQTVADTGLGNVEDKFDKNWRKTMGLLRDLQGARSVGVISMNPEKGYTEIARPVGVVGAIIPSTSPVATLANMTLNALKGRNAIIVSPSPNARRACAKLVEFMHVELERLGAPLDLVQCLPTVNKEAAQELMHHVDLIVVSGSPANVRAAHASGTPAISFGVGNAPVIVDEDAAVDHAAASIVRSKSYDFSTGCSSENSVILVDKVYDSMLSALREHGGLLLRPDEKSRLQNVMWIDGKLNRKVIARSAPLICSLAGIERPDAADARILMVEEDGIGPDYPFSDEKLSPVLAVYRASDFDHALNLTASLLKFRGAGHSIGLYGNNEEHMQRAGLELPTSRVIVNQPNILATGGSFENWMPFSLSIGCGTWGRNISSSNLTYRNFLNIVHISQPVSRSMPTEEELFGGYWKKYGLEFAE